MICCHNATRIVLDSPCLRSMRYHGGLPADGSFSIGNCGSMAAMTLDIYEDIGKRKPREVGSIRLCLATVDRNPRKKSPTGCLG
ncbi:unnamed protein product [Urochloa humidicola]